MSRTERSKLMPTPPPGSLSSFIGRRDELAALTRVLSESRLVTLLGPGGCGKTRLAIEVANRVVRHFDDGVAFVDLAPVQDPATVSEAAAAALGASRQASSDIAELIGDAQLLLVVDNAEHLVDAVSSLVTGLLLDCPRLKVLVTSREILDVAGEVSWSVPRLKLPSAGQAPIPADLLEFDAIELFCARAAERRTGFQLTAQNAELVVAIARRVDGIPLALELAAARVRSMSLPEIVSRLADSFRLLTGGPRTAMDRHRTLAATIDWSHRLLEETERRLFRRLSLFVGTFDLAAVEEICSGTDLPSDAVADVLQRLVDKSLVVAHAMGDGDLRYSLIETIRQYGRERLCEAGETGLRATHAKHYAAVALRLGDDRGGLQTRAQKMVRDYDNVRVALDWAADQDVAMEASLVTSLRWFWLARGSVREAREAVLSALGKAHPEPARRAALYVEAASWHQQVGDLEAGVGYIEKAAELLPELDDPVLVSRVHRTRGVLLCLLGDLESADGYLTQAAAVLTGLPVSEDMVVSLNNLAMMHLMQGRLREALQEVAKMEIALAGFERSPSHPQWLHTQGAVYLAVRRIADASARFLEGLRVAARYGNHAGAIVLLEGLACAASAAGCPALCLELLAAARQCARLAGVGRRNVGTPIEEAERASRLAIGPRAADEWSARGSTLDLGAAIERAASLDRSGGRGALTARKREIVKLVAQGMTNRQIAQRLSISERTVDAHLEQARNELGLRSRAQIAAWAVSEGLLPVHRAS